MAQLVECVPNISEGRNAYIIAQIADAICTTPGIILANVHSDPDHNRSVYTFYGAPLAVQQAASSLAQSAAQLIDMRQHDGMHPCLGALDVCPFVPMQNSSMDECIELARTTAKLIAERLGIPVYLYEKAAFNKESSSLPQIRKGGYQARVGRELTGSWLPDFGPQHLHPTAGASIVGAREPLVAYNINLNGPYIEEARQIARQIRLDRDINPALLGVRALGLLLPSRNQAQVSMNITQPLHTPIEGIYQYVSQQAKELGIQIAEAELVGCIPAHMLQGVVRQAYGLSFIDAAQILPIDL